MRCFVTTQSTFVTLIFKTETHLLCTGGGHSKSKPLNSLATNISPEYLWIRPQLNHWNGFTKEWTFLKIEKKNPGQFPKHFLEL